MPGGPVGGGSSLHQRTITSMSLAAGASTENSREGVEGWPDCSIHAQLDVEILAGRGRRIPTTSFSLRGTGPSIAAQIARNSILEAR